MILRFGVHDALTGDELGSFGRSRRQCHLHCGHERFSDVAHDLTARGFHLRVDSEFRQDFGQDLFVAGCLLEVFLPLGSQVVVDHA